MQSASGGLFSVLADRVLEDGGAVIGAAYDENLTVKHIAVHEPEGLSRLRNSKYVQSDIRDVYQDVEEYVKAGKQTLFSGTPCQVAGLYGFLGEDYDNLVSCDILCHGVPSPLFFSKYLDYLRNHFGASVSSISFRDKRLDWQRDLALARWS